jgi:hypothetical protein
MRNSILVTSDLKSMILVDTQQDDQRLSIGKRGVLLSVLGTDVCATEVPAELDRFIAATLRDTKPFYEFNVADAAKNQLCITYNDVNNTVYIIGITDVIVGFATPEVISKDKVKAVGVRLKRAAETGLISNYVILARLEGEIGSITKKIAFYLVKQETS